MSRKQTLAAIVQQIIHAESEDLICTIILKHLVEDATVYVPLFSFYENLLFMDSYFKDFSLI